MGSCRRGTEVFVKTLTGRTVSVQIRPSQDRVVELKKKLRDILNISERNQTIIFNGKQLRDNEVLETSGVVEESTLHLVTKLCKKTHAHEKAEEPEDASDEVPEEELGRTIEVFVKTSEGRTVPFQVREGQRLGTVLVQLCNLLDVVAPIQIAIDGLPRNGRDNLRSTLAQLGVEDESIFTVSVPNNQTTVYCLDPDPVRPSFIGIVLQTIYGRVAAACAVLNAFPQASLYYLSNCIKAYLWHPLDEASQFINVYALQPLTFFINHQVLRVCFLRAESFLSATYQMLHLYAIGPVRRLFHRSQFTLCRFFDTVSSWVNVASLHIGRLLRAWRRVSAQIAHSIMVNCVRPISNITHQMTSGLYRPARTLLTIIVRQLNYLCLSAQTWCSWFARQLHFATASSSRLAGVFSRTVARAGHNIMMNCAQPVSNMTLAAIRWIYWPVRHVLGFVDHLDDALCRTGDTLVGTFLETVKSLCIGSRDCWVFFQNTMQKTFCDILPQLSSNCASLLRTALSAAFRGVRRIARSALRFSRVIRRAVLHQFEPISRLVSVGARAAYCTCSSSLQHVSRRFSSAVYQMCHVVRYCCNIAGRGLSSTVAATSRLLANSKNVVFHIAVKLRQVGRRVFLYTLQPITRLLSSGARTAHTVISRCSSFTYRSSRYCYNVVRSGFTTAVSSSYRSMARAATTIFDIVVYRPYVATVSLRCAALDRTSATIHFIASSIGSLVHTLMTLSNIIMTRIGHRGRCALSFAYKKLVEPSCGLLNRCFLSLARSGLYAASFFYQHFVDRPCHYLYRFFLQRWVVRPVKLVLSWPYIKYFWRMRSGFPHGVYDVDIPEAFMIDDGRSGLLLANATYRIRIYAGSHRFSPVVCRIHIDHVLVAELQIEDAKVYTIERPTTIDKKFAFVPINPLKHSVIHVEFFRPCTEREKKALHRRRQSAGARSKTRSLQRQPHPTIGADHASPCSERESSGSPSHPALGEKSNQTFRTATTSADMISTCRKQVCLYSFKNAP